MIIPRSDLILPQRGFFIPRAPAIIRRLPLGMPGFDPMPWQRKAAIGTPTVFINQLQSSISSGSNSAATGSDIPAGSTIFVALTNNGQPNEAISTLADSGAGGGNSYLQAVQNAATASIFSCAIWYCLNTTVDLPVGSTFKVTTALGQYGICVIVVTGAKGGLDKTANVAQTSANTGPSLANNPLTQAIEILLGVYNSTNTFGSFTEASGWTSLGTVAASGLPGFAYLIVSSTSGGTYNPRTSGNQTFAAVLATFMATASSSYFPLVCAEMPVRGSFKAVAY